MPRQTTTYFNNTQIQIGDLVWTNGAYGPQAARALAVSSTGILKLRLEHDKRISSDLDVYVENDDNSNLVYNGTAETPDGLGDKEWMVYTPTSAATSAIGAADNAVQVSVTTPESDYLTLDILLAKASIVTITASAAFAGTAAGLFVSKIKVDGVTKRTSSKSLLSSGSGDVMMEAGQLQLGAGPHTIKLSGSVSAGLVTIAANGAHLDAVGLGTY